MENTNNFEFEYSHLADRTTVCSIQTDRGFEIAGVYICKREEIDDQEIREEKAKANAFRALNKANEKYNNR